MEEERGGDIAFVGPGGGASLTPKLVGKKLFEGKNTRADWIELNMPHEHLVCRSAAQRAGVVGYEPCAAARPPEWRRRAFSASTDSRVPGLSLVESRANGQCFVVPGVPGPVSGTWVLDPLSFVEISAM